MDRKIKLIIGLSITSFSVNAMTSNIEQGQYKETIVKLQSLVKESTDPKLVLQLAEVYLLDQNLEKSIETFLGLLDRQGSDVKPARESDIYRQALAVYLEGGRPYVTAQKLIHQFSDYQNDHPDDYGVGFLVSAAYGNLQDYQSFYRTFYKAYVLAPNHYLANKSLAALHIKLYERSKTETEKEAHRQQIEMFTNRAIKQYREDPTLYRWAISFCKESEKSECVKRVMGEVINLERPITRNDIPFYVQHAIATEQYDLTQQFIDKTKEWYDYSRIVEAAQKHLDQQQAN